MSTSFATTLRRYPTLFDFLNCLNRRLWRQSPLYKAINPTLRNLSSFTFLQIGANDGISNDPFREFMIRSAASGLTAEPVPQYFRTMRTNYKAYPNVRPVNCAVGYPAGMLPFYAYSESFLSSKEGSREMAGLASFSREKLTQWLAHDEPADTCVEEIIIPVRTVEELLSENAFTHFDCLFLDCEGYEQNVLTNMDFEQVRPKLIVYEHTHYGERAVEIEAHLATHGFEFTRLTHDTVATRHDTH